MRPFIGLAGMEPRAGRYDSDDEDEPWLMVPSSPISKCVDAMLYVSLNMRGRSGILLKKPHLFWGGSSSVAGVETRGDWERLRLLGALMGLVEDFLEEDGGGRPGSWVRSKTWRVDLSDVTARRDVSGDIAMLKMKAGSTPRRSSASLAQFCVEKTRMRVPVSEAEARRVPSGERSRARRAEACAGMMLTLLVFSSTSWILPGERPGKARREVPRQQRPRWLSAVSKTARRVGGLENW